MLPYLLWYYTEINLQFLWVHNLFKLFSLSYWSCNVNFTKIRLPEISKSVAARLCRESLSFYIEEIAMVNIIFLSCHIWHVYNIFARTNITYLRVSLAGGNGYGVKNLLTHPSVDSYITKFLLPPPPPPSPQGKTNFH